MSANFIVAVELGSSKLRAIAGRKNTDGSISVLAVASEDSSAYIKKGIVHNIEKTVQGITNIVDRLKKQLNREISQVYVGVGGQSLLSVKNRIIRDLPKDTVITQQMVNEMMDENRNKNYADREILDVAIQEYKVGNDEESDPAGIPADRLEGNFLNILWRQSAYNKLFDCLKHTGIKLAEFHIAPLALADCILDDTHKRAGCLLVDLGADTTTMLVWHKNLLRHIAVIPLGGRNITKDLTSLDIESEDAENMKCKYGCAYTEMQDFNKTLDYPINKERGVQSVKFQNVIEARIMEIIKNVWEQVPLEYRDRLNSGIVLTGGGSNLKDVAKAFKIETKIDKVEIVSFINDNVLPGRNITLAHDGTMNTMLGLLLKGDQNCDGGELVQRDLFNNIETEAEQQEQTETPIDTSAAYKPEPATIGGGRVATPTEKEKQRRQQENKEWDDAQTENTIEAYEHFVDTYPNSEYVEKANDMIKALKKKQKAGSMFSSLKRRVIGFLTEDPGDE